MRAREIMSREVKVASPQDTLQQVARLMAELDAGALPVAENDRLVGMVTDRDIAVRGDARGCDPKQTPVREVMSTGKIKYCFEDEEVEAIARNMAEQQIRRLPVVNRDKRLVGIISLGDISAHTSGLTAGEALRGVCERDGTHSPTRAG